MNVLSLFDGVSCGMVALERAGITVDKYYASEIDPYAIQISQKNYPNIIRLGDVTKWREWDIDWASIDLLIGGSPCQSLSITQSKTRQGLDGKSKLFFEFVDILNHIKTYNPKVLFLFENVASMSAESKTAIEGCLGAELIYQNSNAFSAQDRPRVYGTNFKWDTVDEPCGLVLSDIMQNDVDEKYYYNCDFDFVGIDKNVCAYLHINGHDILKRVHSPNFKCHTLTTCGGGNTQKKVYDNGRCRKLTPLEYERLQTLPYNYTAYGLELYEQKFDGSDNICKNAKLTDVTVQSQTVAQDCVINIIYDCKDMEQQNSLEKQSIKLKNAQLMVAKDNKKLMKDFASCIINDGLNMELPSCLKEKLKNAKFVVKMQRQKNCAENIIKILSDMEIQNIQTRLEMVITNMDTKNISIQITELNIEQLLHECLEENLPKKTLYTILILTNLIMTKVIYMFAPKANTALCTSNLKDVQQNCINLDILSLKTENIKSISDNHRYTCCGNGWTVDVIAHILSFITKQND